MLAGASFSPVEIQRAQEAIACLRNRLDHVFEEFDVVISPTAPTTARPLNQMREQLDTAKFDDIFTLPASLAGLPALSIPCGNDRMQLPIGNSTRISF